MMKTRKEIWIVGLMVVVCLTRLLNIIPNFSPLMAVMVFGTALLPRRGSSFLLPLVLIYAVDFIINNTIGRPYFTNQTGLVWFDTYMVWNYLAYIVAAVLSSSLYGKGGVLRGVLLTLLGSVLFFLITNIGAWLDPKLMYDQSANGLVTSLTAALPFFRTSLISDIMCALTLFGSYQTLKSYVFERKMTTV